jgi:hypothetical protein
VQKAIRLGLIALATGMLPAGTLAQTCNTAERSVLLILDASGSMNAKLPNGETRITVAQRAINGVAGIIPARVTTKDGAEAFRFDAIDRRAALPPGDYIVEVDGNKIPFAATEGEVLEVKPQ